MARVRLSFRNGFIPVLIVAAVIIRLKSRAPIWIFGIFIALILLYFYAMPRVIERRLKKLDREIRMRMARGKAKELLPYVRRRIVLRLLAPGPAIASRLGLACASAGEWKPAARYYREALEDGKLTDAQRLPLELGLANACYELGEDKEAEELYRHLAKYGTVLPEASHNLAHVLVRNNRAGKEAERLLDEAEAAATTPGLARRVVLTRAEHALARRRWDSVRELLDGLDPEGLDPELRKRLESLRKRLASNLPE